jgi:hypothetical protein
MYAAIEHARAVGHGVLTLWVRRENGRAHRFYEKHGMREDGKERRRSHDILPTDERDSLSNVALNPPNSTIATRRARLAARAPGAPSCRGVFPRPHTRWDDERQRIAVTPELHSTERPL